MSTPLLATKLYTPRTRPELVARPHLIERLNEGLQRKLTLISAPAGFGKTTMLSDWLGRIDLPAAWLSLDEGDNDPTRFLNYLIAALQQIDAGIGQSLQGTLQSPQPPPAETLMTALINDIAATSAEFALGLDDYHVIEAGPIHRAVTFTLDHLPPNMHLVIATRAEPPLPLARLRARGQMTELGAHDLRFTIDEAASFLNELMGLDLSVEDVAALEERTEGWIAGLQLAALSMQGREDLPSFIQAFAGSHRYVLDYLAEEVLQRQPEEVQTFLLQTAVLERLTGSLCDALTGQGDAQRMLERLGGANLFITPLDDERRWYRYHNLFADFLRARLRGGYLERIPDLHRAAALWYEQNGSAGEAIKHLLAAEAFDPAADLVEQTARGLLARGEYTTITSWLAALPEDLVRSRPRLCLAHLRALASARDIGGMQGRLHDLEAVLSSPQAPSFTSAEMDHFRGEAAAYQALLAFWRDEDARTAIALCQRALKNLA